MQAKIGGPAAADRRAPGYRVDFSRDGEALVILLTGGTKKRQQRDINAAITYCQDYKRGTRGKR